MSINIDWRDGKGFYKSEEPCDVCKSIKEVGCEPRFGYNICENHHHMTPIEVGNIMKLFSMEIKK